MFGGVKLNLIEFTSSFKESQLGGKYKKGTSLFHAVCLSSKILQKAMYLFSEIQHSRR